MGQDFLTGLALLNIHTSIILNVDGVIDSFASMKKKYRLCYVKKYALFYQIFKKKFRGRN